MRFQLTAKRSAQDRSKDAGLRSNACEPSGLVALTAFNGTTIGLCCCIAAGLKSDAMLSFVAGFGAAICLWVWKLHLIDGAARHGIDAGSHDTE
jgi:hypothetical protein